jgi:hypothetical protein
MVTGAPSITLQPFSSACLAGKSLLLVYTLPGQR